jgi:hypothetical protein
MGDVSHVVPSIHPWLAIVDKGEALCHEIPFAKAAASSKGIETALVAAKAMARTLVEILTDATLREALRADFEARRPGA